MFSTAFDTETHRVEAFVVVRLYFITGVPLQNVQALVIPIHGLYTGKSLFKAFVKLLQALTGGDGNSDSLVSPLIKLPR